MIVTEKEARTKWCPFSRARYERAAGGLDGDTRPAINRPHLPEAFTDHACIASECMAWQWRRKFMHINDREPTLSKTEGYCGLAP